MYFNSVRQQQQPPWKQQLLLEQQQSQEQPLALPQDQEPLRLQEYAQEKQPRLREDMGAALSKTSQVLAK
jgi:hypothetical protein